MNAFSATLIGDSPALQGILRAAEIVAVTDATVLILGESGTGKELLARAIQKTSRRAKGPFVTLNCAALPESLVESELFGHNRGAFTGASVRREGRLQAAHGGTILLDEISELSLAAQAKLLRFLETGECQRLGDTWPQQVDVRVLAATNQDLHGLVKSGRFRKDLYYRLCVVPLELPPLRIRHDDVLQLLSRFTAALARDHDLVPPQYKTETLALLKHYPWPGNVRELRNFCERMLILFSGRHIGPGNLPPELRATKENIENRFSWRLPSNGISMVEFEAHMIRQALQQAAGNRSRAARLLGLTRDTLLYRMKKYTIEV